MSLLGFMTLLFDSLNYLISSTQFVFSFANLSTSIQYYLISIHESNTYSILKNKIGKVYQTSDGIRQGWNLVHSGVGAPDMQK